MFQTFISRHNSNFFSDKLVLCVSKNVSVSCAYTQGKREQFSGFNRTLDAINNVFRKFSAFHDETGRLNVDGMNIISNDGSNKLNRSRLPKKLFRIRMSRNFGMKMLTMTNLSTECLIQLTKLGYDATPFNQILKQNAKREMRLRLGKVTVADVL